MLWRGQAARPLHCLTPSEAKLEIKPSHVEVQGVSSRKNEAGAERLLVTYRRSWFSISNPASAPAWTGASRKPGRAALRGI